MEFGECVMKINELVLRNRFVVEAGPVPPVEDTAAAPAATTTPPAATAAPAAAPAAKGPNFWDRAGAAFTQAKAGLAGAKAGYKSSQAQQAGVASAEKTAAVLIDRWGQAIGQDPAANTPENLQAFMTKSTEKSGIAVPPAPAVLNDVTTAKYITDVTGKSLAASRLGLPSARKEPVAPQTQAATTQQPQQQAAQPLAAAEPVAQQTQAATTQTDTATQAQQQVQQPVEKGYGDQSISPTEVNVNYKGNADNLIKQAGNDPEKIKSLIAALQGTPERAPP